MIVIGTSIALKNSVPIGFTAVSLASLISFGDSIKQFVILWTRTETSLGALVRIKSFTEECKAEDEGLKETIDPGNHWPAEGKISIHRYSAAYKEQVNTY